MTDVPLEEDPRPDGLRVAKSLVLVNTGDGKGKSSAAFGVAMRARARDWPVAVVQFLKSDDCYAIKTSTSACCWLSLDSCCFQSRVAR